jgi:hypothetical protein
MSCERCILLAFLFVALLFPANGQDSQPLDAKTRQLVEKIAKASSVKDAALANKALFKTKDRNLIRRLKNVSEKGIAIRAAWEEVAFSGLKKDVRKIFDREEPCLAVNPLAAARFIGFVEGKLGIQLPSWWEEAVRAAATWERDEPIYPGKPKETPYHYFDLDGHQIGLPKTMTLEKKGEGILIRTAKESMVLSRAIAKEIWTSSLTLSGSLSKERCILAFHNDIGCSFQLVCLDRTSGKKLWESTVWDSRQAGGGTGIPQEYVSVLDNGQSVFVFGSSDRCFFIEAFDSKTGRNQFRFASRYWDELP